MSEAPPVRNGQMCRVVAGTHRGKAGSVADVHLSKGGHWTVTVVPADGPRFKTLARNLAVECD